MTDDSHELKESQNSQQDDFTQPIDLERYDTSRLMLFAIGRLLQRCQFHLQQSFWLDWQARRLTQGSHSFGRKSADCIARDLLSVDVRRLANRERSAARQQMSLVLKAIHRLPHSDESEDYLQRLVQNRFSRLQVEAPVEVWSSRELKHLLPRKSHAQFRREISRNPSTWVRSGIDKIRSLFRTSLGSIFPIWLARGHVFETGLSVSDVAEFMEFGNRERTWRDVDNVASNSDRSQTGGTNWFELAEPAVRTVRTVGELQPNPNWYADAGRLFGKDILNTRPSSPIDVVPSEPPSRPANRAQFNSILARIHRVFVDKELEKEISILRENETGLAGSKADGRRLNNRGDAAGTQSAQSHNDDDQSNRTELALGVFKDKYSQAYSRQIEGGEVRGPIHLTPKKQSLFEALLQANRSGLSREAAQEAWELGSSDGTEASLSAVYSAIRELRKEIEALYLTIPRVKKSMPYQIISTVEIPRPDELIDGVGEQADSP